MAGYYYEITDTDNLNSILTLAQAKKQLKMEDLGDHDDTIIQECIDAAVIEAENYINAAIHARSFRLDADCFLQDYELRLQKATAITAVTYTTDTESTTLATQEAIDAFVELLPIDKFATKLNFIDEVLPTLKSNLNSAVKLTISYGYADGKVPKAIIQAVKLLMTDNYNIRNNIPVKGRTKAQKLLSPYIFIPSPSE